MSARRRSSAGNGDVCPVVPEHGQMLMLVSGRQYCADQSHDPHGKSPATPNLWAGGYRSFAAEVAAYHEGTKAAVELPDIEEFDLA